MKVFMASCFMFLAGMIASVRFSQAAVTGAAMVGNVLTGADQLTALISKMDKMFLEPTIDKINEEIARINTNIDGLGSDEKRLVSDAKNKLISGRSDVQAAQVIMNDLADQTITGSNDLLAILNRILSGNQPTSEQQKGIDQSVSKMTALLTRSKSLIKQAKVKYEKVQDTLLQVQVKLQEFSKRVDDLSNRSSSRHSRHVADMRKKVYGGAAACMVFPPACIPVYAAAAATLESLVKKWASSLDALRNQCLQSKNSANHVINDVKSDISTMGQEEALLGNWESKISMMYSDFKGGQYIKTAIDMDEFEKDYSVNQLKALIVACEVYEQHSRNFS